jgi:enoyl-CoA hydratase/carnithine racemase
MTVATLSLHHGKVNALTPEVIAGLDRSLTDLEADAAVRAVVLTGEGSFFSFGFDIPLFLSYSRERFSEFLRDFTAFYTRLFLFPKPVVAAVNGHAIAGGCMLALACDERVMAAGRARIGLNEIEFGSTIFAGSAEMLRFATGEARATRTLYSGGMFVAEEALALGLVDEVTAADEVMPRALARAEVLAKKSSAAFASMKQLLREPVGRFMREREAASIREFVDIWYSEETWANLQKITIR